MRIPKPFENDIICLRALQRTDFEALFAAAKDKEIWAQHPDFNRYTREGFTTYFEKLTATDQPFVIIDKKSGAIIGATSYYQYAAAESKIAIGFTFLAKSYWGTGLNQSLKKLMMQQAFTFASRVVFHVREKNFRSQAALVKIGATKVKEYPAPADPSTLQFEYHIERDNWVDK